MKTALKIVKINLLSIISLPLLLISTFSKLISKSIEKLLLIVVLAVYTGIIALALEIFNNPGKSLDVVLTIIVLLIIGSIIFAVIFIIISIASTLIASFIMLIKGMLEVIYEVFSNLYEMTLNICLKDFEYINDDNKKIKSSLLCIFFTILKIINRVIILFLSNGLKICIIGSLILAFGPIIYISSIVKKDFGIGIIEYVSMFNWYSNFHGILMYIIVIGGLCFILIGLGAEFEEWGEELAFSTSGYGEYVDSILDKNNMIEEILFRRNKIEEDDEEVKKYSKYINDLEEHLSSIDELNNNVISIGIEGSENVVLKNKFSTYISNMNDIVNIIAKYNNEIPIRVLKTLEPKIKQLNSLKKDILNLIEKAKQERRDFKATKSDTSKKQSFFTGCNNKETLDKRYKSLCKVYHPDIQSGDEETFKAVKMEYDSLKKMFS